MGLSLDTNCTDCIRQIDLSVRKGIGVAPGSKVHLEAIPSIFEEFGIYKLIVHIQSPYFSAGGKIVQEQEVILTADANINTDKMIICPVDRGENPLLYKYRLEAVMDTGESSISPVWEESRKLTQFFGTSQLEKLIQRVEKVPSTENSKMKYSLLTIFLILLSWSHCIASPALDVYYDIEETRVYQDHIESSLWYISPSRPFLKIKEDKSPDYGLSIYRYLGRKGTGDAGDFWVKGVLTFGIDRSKESGLNTEIRKALRDKGISSPRLKSMPVSASKVTLIFSDHEQTFETGLRWKSGIMVIPLNKENAEILWGAVEKGQTLVSVAFEETLTGLKKKGDEWQSAFTPLSFTMSVEMEMSAYPDHFRKIDLGGTMKVGYTGIDLFCFDFAENLNENLYAKMVEIAIPSTGRDLVESFTFKEGGDYSTRIEFKLAKDLDRPYRYRVTRIFKDGREETSQWLQKSGETLLDITEYKNNDDIKD